MNCFLSAKYGTNSTEFTGHVICSNKEIENHRREIHRQEISKTKNYFSFSKLFESLFIPIFSMVFQHSSISICSYFKKFVASYHNWPKILRKLSRQNYTVILPCGGHFRQMRILFLRSGTSDVDDPYIARARTEGFEAFSFSPIKKSELPQDRLLDHFSQLDRFDGIIMTSVATGLVSFLRTFTDF